MYLSFFTSAAQSPPRQTALRTMVTAHLLVLLACAWLIHTGTRRMAPLTGHFLLVAGIVEGALLVGWRLTQLPKSRALEFLLASPLAPPRIFLTEAAIGLLRLAFVTLAGLPVLLLLTLDGVFQTADLLPLLLLPLTWGGITGLALTAWAYEPAAVRRWGERFLFLLVLVYLVVGVMAGENLRLWIAGLPPALGAAVLDGYYGFHTYNPFAVMQYSLETVPAAAVGRWLPVELASAAAVVVLLARAAGRFQGHYQERHYSPIVGPAGQRRAPVGDRPLSWWAVKRVSEFSGKVNLWLAGGFGVLYALHTAAGPYWPAWMGRQVFVVFDQFFGIAGVAAALVVLAAVPAAFQYGLWDSNTQDRCRRLELLLMTELNAGDYWSAALAAAWRRGGGYFLIAALLWLAAVAGGKMTAGQAAAGLAAGVILWLCYFSLGFRAFTRGMQAGNLGLLLTAVLPLLAMTLFHAGAGRWAALTPPGAVYAVSAGVEPLSVVLGLSAAVAVTVYVERSALARCAEELRRWYEKFHGQKVID